MTSPLLDQIQSALARVKDPEIKRPITGSPAELWVQTNPAAYAELATRHRGGVRWLRD